MNATIPPATPPDPDWQDLVLERGSAGYDVGERPAGRCCVLRRVALRRVGLTLVLASSLSWLVGSVAGTVGILAHGAVALLLCGAGLACLLGAWRCATRLVQVDFRAMHLRVATRDAGGRVRVQHVVPFDAIASLYLRRSERGSPAMLILRPVGGADEIALIGAPKAELETLHRKLSRDIAQRLAGARHEVVPMPNRAVTPRRVTLPRRAGRRQAACVGG